MKRSIDPVGFLISTGVLVGLSLIAFPFLYFDIGSARYLHALVYFPLCVASGALYVGVVAKRRADLSIAALGLGGALAAILPAFVLTMADSMTIVLALVFAVFGAVLGCLGAIVWAMRDEAKFLRKNQRSDSPRPLPKSRKRRI